MTGNNEESASHWENKYRDLYSALDSGFCVIEMQFDVTGRPCDYVYKELNAHFEAQSGLKDVLGRRALEVLPDHGQEWFDIYGRIAMTGVSERFENRIDAIGRWYEILAFRIGQPEQRQVGVLFNDIDTRKRAELALQASDARQSFLLKLGDELRPVSDAATIQQIASQRLAEFLKADRVGYAEDDGNTGEVVVTHDHARTIANIEGRHLYESFGADLLATLRAGRPVIHNDISDDPLLTDVEKQAYDLLGIGAVLNVPLLKDGALEAILFVHYQRPHVFTEAEVALAWEVGERTWAEVMRARTETALKDSKASLAAVFESLPVGAGLFDAASGRMVLANAAMKPYLPTGAMPSRDAERGWRWEAWDAQGNPVPREQFPGARALRGEHVVPGMEMLYTSDSGENMWTSVSAVPVRDERGQITGQVGVIMDIDAIKRTEASLRVAEARWRILTDAMPHLVWIAEAREAGSIYVNDRFASYTGQTSAQLLGFRWMKSIHPDDVESVKSAWLNLPDDEEGFEVEFRLRRHDGVYRWFLGRVVPAPLTDGNGQQWIGVCADIQSLMEARFQAEAADRAKSEFLANISHEIRTPLNAIVGLTSILTSAHSNPSMYPKYFRTMQDSSNALHELINDILEFSRLDADMVELSETEFALSDLLGEVERISAVKADAKGLSLGIQDFTGQTRLYVADGHRIKQILLNLMSNAVKFTHKGSVNLMVSEGASIDGRETLTFCVRDTGIGIASDKLEAIFEKFTQVDGSYSRRFGGTGLGLAISKRLAQTMGGTLRVESELGEGAAFLLTVPVSYLSGPADGASSDGVMGNVKAETAALQHALLVEDNPVNAMVAETMLQKLGCTFETANTGFAAIEKWRQGDFDIILLDLQMPDMDGLTVARRIRQMEREAGARPVKIVALTAHAFTNDREKALSAGMDGYLTKPYTIHSLSQVLS
ncbi:ATP-binding protein [Asticcacaulis tiandongensis]|uniref:ATP-binding protein n=1 Tax=Asticcacaulis tiandongensis TaxID=2565365 RepID=UPI0015E85648|nr:ATP-binding protein [Asticcacaulis tiandongensis]